MTLTFSIEPDSGSICIGPFRLSAFQPKAEIEPRIAHLVERSRDHGNGYAWLYLQGVSFGGQPAVLSLCFHLGRLEQAGWSVTLPNEAERGRMARREAIDAEVASFGTYWGAKTAPVQNGDRPCRSVGRNGEQLRPKADVASRSALPHPPDAAMS